MAKAHETLANCRAFKGSSKDICEGKIMMNVCEFIDVFMICIYIWFPVPSIWLLCHFATFKPKLSSPQKSFQWTKLHLLVSLES